MVLDIVGKPGQRVLIEFGMQVEPPAFYNVMQCFSFKVRAKSLDQLLRSKTGQQPRPEQDTMLHEFLEP